MLSICIPTYNYNVVPLVTELHQQASTANIQFHILVADDFSTQPEIVEQNRKIRSFSNVEFIELSKNIGRSSIRNLLASKAKYEYLLFLDCDVSPEAENFIQDYWDNRVDNGVVIGGLVYRNELPNDDVSLRWHYGHNRETTTAKQRNLKPYRSFMTGCFLIARSVFNSLKFDETIDQYGHEDTLFGIALRNEGISIRHIDNRVFHDGLESNEVFIQKTKRAIANSILLSEQHVLQTEIIAQIKLLKVFYQLKKLRLVKPIAHWFERNEKKLLIKLNAPHPNLRIFDLYKLAYLCKLSVSD